LDAEANPVFQLAMISLQQWLSTTLDAQVIEPTTVYTRLPTSNVAWLEYKGALHAEPYQRWSNFPIQDTEAQCLTKAYETQRGKFWDLPSFAATQTLFRIDVALAKGYDLVLYKDGQSYMLVKVGNTWGTDSARISIPAVCYTKYEATLAHCQNPGSTPTD